MYIFVCVECVWMLKMGVRCDDFEIHVNSVLHYWQ